ncbi:MAG: hypothetical protein WD227_16770 [Vicinamibacterales bacterium]
MRPLAARFREPGDRARLDPSYERGQVRTYHELFPTASTRSVVAGASTIATIEAEADDVVCLYAPTEFYAVGQYVDECSEVTDEMVVTALSRAVPAA